MGKGNVIRGTPVADRRPSPTSHASCGPTPGSPTCPTATPAATWPTAAGETACPAAGSASANPAVARGEAVWHTFFACPSMQEPSRERDAVWLAVQSAICTHGFSRVTPMGSTSPVLISAEQATDELIAAMSWLARHEDEARGLDPLNLFITLRGVATRGADGSARAAQADALHGMTNVPLGRMLFWRPIDETGVA